jgi:hypothetical protein
MVADLEEKHKLMLEFCEMLNLETFEVSDELLDKLRKLNETDIFENEPNFQKGIEILRNKGYNV